MKKLLNAMLNLPLYSTQEWDTILAVRNAPKKSQLAIVEEMKAQGIYKDLSLAIMLLETQIPIILEEMKNLEERISTEWNNQTDLTLTGETLENIFKQLMRWFFEDNAFEMRAPVENVMSLIKLLKLHIPTHYCFVSLNNALENNDSLSTPPPFTQNQISPVINRLTLHEEKFNVVPLNKPKDPQQFNDNLNMILEQQFEIVLSYQINSEIQKYKLLLEKYIKNEFLTHYTDTYISYFNAHPQLIELLIIGRDPIINIYNELPTSEALQKIMQEHPNLQRAIANYQKMFNAQNILTYSPEKANFAPELATPHGRINALFKCYSHFERHLKTIDSVPVDNSTHQIKQFFKMLWSKLNWFFSRIHIQEGKFSSEIKFLRDQYGFFKTKKIQATHNSKLEIPITNSINQSG